MVRIRLNMDEGILKCSLFKSMDSNVYVSTYNSRPLNDTYVPRVAFPDSCDADILLMGLELVAFIIFCDLYLYIFYKYTSILYFTIHNSQFIILK